MDEEDRERLRLNHQMFEQDLMPKDILAYLFQEGIISQHTWDEILAIEPKTDLTRTRELLKRLPKCGPNAYSIFRKGLDEYGFSFLGKALDATEVNIIRREDWLNGLSSNVRERNPSDQELNRLACNLGTNWEQIAVTLDLKPVQIEQLKMQHGSGHIPTLIFKMFVKWRSVKGKKATWQVLLKALIDCDINPAMYESVVSQSTS